MARTDDERIKILQMLEEEKITAEEATSLLRALGGGRRATSEGSALSGDNRYLHVRVTDMASGKNKVNVTLPMSLVGAGLRMAERFAPEFEGFDMQELEEALVSGAVGKIVEVRDEEDNELVEIYIE